MNHSLPGSSVHGILRQEYWSGLAMLSFRGSSRPRDWTLVSCSSCVTGRFFTTEPLFHLRVNQIPLKQLNKAAYCNYSLTGRLNYLTTFLLLVLVPTPCPQSHASHLQKDFKSLDTIHLELFITEKELERLSTGQSQRVIHLTDLLFSFGSHSDDSVSQNRKVWSSIDSCFGSLTIEKLSCIIRQVDTIPNIQRAFSWFWNTVTYINTI